jgi:hypothetical protein
MFFFEKKTKNSCETWPSRSGQAEAKMIKGFLLLFFKKEGLPALIWKLRRGTAPRHRHASQPGRSGRPSGSAAPA